MTQRLSRCTFEYEAHDDQNEPWPTIVRYVIWTVENDFIKGYMELSSQQRGSLLTKWKSSITFKKVQQTLRDNIRADFISKGCTEYGEWVETSKGGFKKLACANGNDGAEMAAEAVVEANTSIFEVSNTEFVVSPSSNLELSDITNAADAFTVGGKRVRKTNETPPRVSVIDLISVIDKKDNKQASTIFARLKNQFECSTICGTFKFPGGHGGNQDTPVTDARGVVTIINLLSGRRAEQHLQT